MSKNFPKMFEKGFSFSSSKSELNSGGLWNLLLYCTKAMPVKKMIGIQPGLGAMVTTAAMKASKGLSTAFAHQEPKLLEP